MQEKAQKKSPIKRNILQYLEYMGISQYEFYKKTGITRGILGQDNGISEENMSKFLAYYPEINPEWLLTGKGPMLRPDAGAIYNNVEEPPVKKGAKAGPPQPDPAAALYSMLLERSENLARENERVKIENEQLKAEIEALKNSREQSGSGNYATASPSPRTFVAASEKEYAVK